MMKRRIGMIVPSLNTIAEDDFRAFCPDDVAYHVHRVRLRKENGRVRMEGLQRAYLEAVDAGELVTDMSPDAVAFNCTGASVSFGPGCDHALAARMTERLGVPSTNTMVAVKEALAALGADNLLHICPFTDEFSAIERDSLVAAGFTVARTVPLDFADAKVAALMDPPRIAEVVRDRVDDTVGGVLLSCANVRAFEAAAELEETLGRPVVTSNQAMLWGVLAAAGWTGDVPGAGRLFDSLRTGEEVAG
jgi:maleate isomerase